MAIQFNHTDPFGHVDPQAVADLVGWAYQLRAQRAVIEVGIWKDTNEHTGNFQNPMEVETYIAHNEDGSTEFTDLMAAAVTEGLDSVMNFVKAHNAAINAGTPI